MKILDQDITKGLPAFMWAENVEETALTQIYNLANLPFAFHHIAIMPDCHSGYGMPIGGVLATEGVVIPYAIGKDIGCGMCAVKTSLKIEQLDTETLKKIMGNIRKVIPVGVGGSHKEKQDEKLMPLLPDSCWGDNAYIFQREYQSVLKQLGTLGAGNHFIEIQKDTENNIWIMIHSGSRNLGSKVCDYYNELAIELNKRWYSSVPKEWELAFLPIESQEAKDYMLEMQYCVDFALANRKLMMHRVESIFYSIVKNLPEPLSLVELGNNISGVLEMFPEPIINIAHNYAAWENHYGKNVLVHRKGATLAREGTIGIIPGSQGSKSYIVRGKGNPKSFMSCSHGAGRKLGRNQAKKTLDLAAEIKRLDDQGIVHGIRHQNDLDEATSAYKSIDEVMKLQEDLVEILVELTPLGVIKG